MGFFDYRVKDVVYRYLFRVCGYLEVIYDLKKENVEILI